MSKVLAVYKYRRCEYYCYFPKEAAPEKCEGNVGTFARKGNCTRVRRQQTQANLPGIPKSGARDAPHFCSLLPSSSLLHHHRRRQRPPTHARRRLKPPDHRQPHHAVRTISQPTVIRRDLSRPPVCLRCLFVVQTRRSHRPVNIFQQCSVSDAPAHAGPDPPPRRRRRGPPRRHRWQHKRCSLYLAQP